MSGSPDTKQSAPTFRASATSSKVTVKRKLSLKTGGHEYPADRVAP